MKSSSRVQPIPGQNRAAKGDPPLDAAFPTVPFPDLSGTVSPADPPPSSSHHPDMNMKQARAPLVSARSTPSPRTTLEGTSAPISLPESHVRRTPSELQLADSVRRAEQNTLRMHSRLLRKRQEQARRRFLAGDGKEQLEGIHEVAKSKLAEAQETMGRQEPKFHAQADGGWSMSYVSIEEDARAAEAPRSGPRSRSAPDTEESDLEDDGVFSMEL